MDGAIVHDLNHEVVIVEIERRRFSLVGALPRLPAKKYSLKSRFWPHSRGREWVPKCRKVPPEGPIQAPSPSHPSQPSQPGQSRLEPASHTHPVQSCHRHPSHWSMAYQFSVGSINNHLPLSSKPISDREPWPIPHLHLLTLFASLI